MVALAGEPESRQGPSWVGRMVRGASGSEVADPQRAEILANGFAEERVAGDAGQPCTMVYKYWS